MEGVNKKNPTDRYIEQKLREQNNSPEIGKLSVGADFVFYDDPQTGEKKVIVVEINGHNSANYGVRGWLKEHGNHLQKIFTDTRNNEVDFLEMTDRAAEVEFRQIRNDYYVFEGAHNKCIEEFDNIWNREDRKLSFSQELSEWREKWAKTYPKYVKDISAFISKYLGSPHFKYSYDNPQKIEDTLWNKKSQQEIIPEMYRPRSWERGEKTKSKFGWWILKPLYGMQQKGIFKIPDWKLKVYVNLYPNFIKKFLVQELYPSCGADNAYGRGIGKHASMRLSWDVSLRQDGSVEVENENSTQYVFSRREGNAKTSAPDWAAFDLKKATSSVPASKEELEMARGALRESLKLIIQKFYLNRLEKDE